MPRKQNPSIHTIPEEYVFFACEKFSQGVPIGIIHELLEKDIEISRGQIYPLITRGFDIGFIRLCPPTEMELSQKLTTLFPLAPGDIQVLNVGGTDTMNALALAGAEKVLLLIKELGKKDKKDRKEQEKKEKKKEKEEKEEKEKAVHIGIGGGRTAERVCSYLATLLRSETRKEMPPIVLHAISSGFSPMNPITAPIAFFSYFRSLPDLDIEYVGLFSEAMVRFKDYIDVKKSPGVKEAFAERKKIDIVVTSLASSNDPDGQFNAFLKLGPASAKKELREKGWLGDVQWRPYSAEGPIVTETGIRSVTLFELEDLVKLARTPRKHVILIGSPCANKEYSKGVAIRPLLEQPKLRVFNHLITDVRTATDILQP